MNDIAEVLRGLPYFADLPQTLLDQVCRESESIEIDPETTIIQEDSLSEDMFVIVDGELRVTKRGTDREVVLATLGPGEVVGEIALLDNAPRTASVTAISKSSLIRIPANAFEDLIQDSRVVRRMFRTVTSRLRGIEDTLADTGQVRGGEAVEVERLAAPRHRLALTGRQEDQHGGHPMRMAAAAVT